MTAQTNDNNLITGSLGDTSTEDPNKDNLADGSLDKGKKKAIRNILKPIHEDEAMYRLFKILAYFVCIAFGAWFLCSGLNHATNILEAQEKAIISNANLMDAKTNYLKNINEKSPTDKSKKSAPVKDEIKDTKSESKDSPLSDKIISASSILTLLAFIFGVGLTLLLTLLKFSFNSQKEETTPELATPLGVLLLDILKGLKDKISQNK